MYLFLLIVFRIGGKRSMAQITPFDLVLLLVIAEATQQGLIGEDFSMTNAALVIGTLVGIDIALSLWRLRSVRIEKLLDDAPLILVREGSPLKARMRKERVDELDIMEAARRQHGLERMDQIKYAVLETSGGITVIPWRVDPAQDVARREATHPARDPGL
jgi:uncharacterized membrane protein YcaP (DUF421 family)